MTAKIKRAAGGAGHRHKNKHKPRGVSHKAFERVYWPYLPLVLIVGLLLSVGSQGGMLQAAVRHPLGRVLSYSTSMSVGGLLADTNNARVSNGVSPFTLNDKLVAAAQAKANDMAARDYWSHNTPEGNPPWIFVTAQGYSYQKLGENLATGFNDEQSTINGWLASPPHRENMLDPAFSDVGFGYANNPNYTAAGGGPMTIVVAFYGQPAGSVAQPVAAPISPAPAKPPAAPVNIKPAASPAPTQSQPPASALVKDDSGLKKPRPVNTSSPPQNGTLTYKSSRAQLALANLPLSTIATTLASTTIFAAAGLWASRHMLALRRVFVYGEHFVVGHPLFDVGLVIIAAIGFLMSQTAGFIQ